MTISLDGYYEGANKELDWHNVDDEFTTYIVEMLRAAETLIMGRKTYELMASYWPTAKDNDPATTELMNKSPKLVFSNTLKSVDWENSRLAGGSIAEEVARLKKLPGDGLLWVGGSDLASSFLEQGLIDEVRFIFVPILLGAGKTVFGDIKKRHALKLVSAKPFKSGNIVATYVPSPS